MNYRIGFQMLVLPPANKLCLSSNVSWIFALCHSSQTKRCSLEFSQRSIRGHSTTSIVLCRPSLVSLGSTETAILELPYIVYEGLLAESAKILRHNSVSHLLGRGEHVTCIKYPARG